MFLGRAVPLFVDACVLVILVFLRDTGRFLAVALDGFLLALIMLRSEWSPRAIVMAHS